MSCLMKLAVMLLLALAISTAGLAQVELGETVDNAAFAVDYPSGWIVDAFLSEGEDGTLLPVVFLYSSAAVQDAVMQGNTTLPQGEAAAYVFSSDDGMYTVEAAMEQFIADEVVSGSQFGEISEIETPHYTGLITSFATPLGGEGFAGVLGSRELRITFATLAAQGDLADYEETFEAIINSIRPGGETRGGQGSSGAVTGNALTLAYGDTATGVITDSDGDVWTFEGQAGDVVSISMNAQALDSYLEVYANNRLLAEDDDSGGSLNALITGLELPADGTYTIIARTFGGSGRGGYELTLSTTASGSSSGIAANDALQSFVEGNLPLGETQRYTFAGNATQMVTILLESDALTMDAFINLYDPSGNLLIQDDDSAGNLNAIIENFMLPTNGTYTVEVTTAYGDGGGMYRLTLIGAELNGVQTRATIPGGPGSPIAIGDVVTGNLPLGESIDYTFEGAAGMVVTITLESDAVSMDPYLELRGPTMRLIAEDDDSAGNLNARISRVTLPSDGIYTIVVRTFGNQGGGEYTLTLR